MVHKSIALAKDFKQSFLSCEQNTEKIWRKLLIESKPYSDKIKRLLLINTKDCLDETQKQYQTKIDSYSLRKLQEENYIGSVPRLQLEDHSLVKSYVVLQFEDFTPSANPKFRNSTISFTILCNLDCWEMDDYKQRPYQIAGYIDGLLDDSKLSGIGTLQFLGAKQILINQNFGGLILMYRSTQEKQADQNPDLG